MNDNTDISQEAGDSSNQYASARDMSVTNKKNELHIHNQNASNKYSEYLKLVEEFEKELEAGGTDLIEFIDKIRHYISVVDEEVVGLHEKLKRAGFEKQYNRVNHLKEKYFKELTENELSKAAQKIHAHVLAKVWSSFLLHVNPAIDEEFSHQQIFVIMDEKVIQPVQEMLAEKNVLNFDSSDIIGMIYFLTGNCHINWD